MNEETVIFLRALCFKVKEIANLAGKYLEVESKKATGKTL